MQKPKSALSKQTEKYSEGVHARSHSLREYNYYLHQIGISTGLEEIVREIIQVKKCARVMDVGCGEAQALEELKEKFQKQIHTIGIDALPGAEKNADEFILGDALEVTFPSEVDIVVSFRAMHEIGSIEKIMEKIGKCLAEQGRVFLSIRVRTENGEWEGEINEKDEKFLLKISNEKKYKSCKITGTLHFEKPTQDSRKLTGVNLTLEKQAAKGISMQ